MRRANDSITLALDIYRRNTISSEKHPAIIFVHGGGFWEGDKRNDVYTKMASAFALHGYIAFSVNYTLKDKASPYNISVLHGCISDVLAAIRWIHANSEALGIDTSKIFVCGDSAGGAIVVNLSYDPGYKCDVAGCIDLWGGLPVTGFGCACIFRYTQQSYSTNLYHTRHQRPGCYPMQQAGNWRMTYCQRYIP